MHSNSIHHLESAPPDIQGFIREYMDGGRDKHYIKAVERAIVNVKKYKAEYKDSKIPRNEYQRLFGGNASIARKIVQSFVIKNSMVEWNKEIWQKFIWLHFFFTGDYSVSKKRLLELTKTKEMTFTEAALSKPLDEMSPSERNMYDRLTLTDEYKHFRKG